MLRIFLILIVSAMVSFGVTSPGFLFHFNQVDTTSVIEQEKGDVGTVDGSVLERGYDVPMPEGEPLPPPPDDDEPELAELGPNPR